MFSKTSRKDVAKDKVAEAVSTVGDATDVAREKAAPVIESAAERLSDAVDAAQPQVAKATKKAKKSAGKAAKKAAKKARAASDQAYAALPEQARSTVELVVPQVATKRHRKGKLFIALGLVAGAAAVALLVRGKQQSGGGAVAASELPEVERRDAAAAEAETEPVTLPGSDDAVGDAEQQVDAAVSGRKGRHAAQE